MFIASWIFKSKTCLAVPLLGIFSKFESKHLSGYLYTHVHNSDVHKAKDISNPNVHRWVNG